MQLNKLKDKVSLLPRGSGVYKFLDKDKTILYVGKAHSLISRVGSYFTDDHQDRPRIINMIPLIYDIEVIETENDIEALILESALIKQIQPKFNSDAKDDKSYAYLFIDTKSDYPTVKIVRYLNKKELKNGKIFGPYPSGRAIKRVFKYLRRIYPFCTAKDPTKPCFDMHIGLCPGPIPSEQYKVNIDGIINFLSGRNKNLIKQLEDDMKQYSSMQEYEKAAALRDKIEDLKYLSSRIDSSGLNSESEYLEVKKKRSINNIIKLAKELNMTHARRIECYDISNIQGKQAYGSMTVALDGQLDNSRYRIFKIKGEDTPNDPGMLKEVLQRRIGHINSDVDPSLGSKPDIILIDGGSSQLGVVKEIIPKDITVLGITKGRKYKRKGGRLLDEFLIVKDSGVLPIKLRNTKILVQLRDEAHRFAILHHRKARGKNQIKSFYDDIPLIGPKTKKILKTKYSSKEELKKATYEELLSLIKNKRIVDSLTRYLKRIK